MARKLTRTVLYYNRGSKCCLRLLVSLYSLRKVYSGNVLLVLEGEQPIWFMRIICRYFPEVEIKEIKRSNTKNTLNVKSSLWRYSDYDLTMFLDSDTIVLRSIDKFFDLIQKGGFVTTKFCDWVTSGSKMRHRILSWKPVLPQEYLDAAIDFGPAVNTGVNGWRKMDPFLIQWEEMCALGAPHKCSDRVADEIACQLLLHTNDHKLGGPEWNTSVKFGKETPETKIIHYHGQKHVEQFPMCDHWKNTYKEMIRLGILEANTRYDDRRISSYLGLNKATYPLTNVTAVNKAYFNKLARHLPQWMETDYFKEQPMLVMSHYDCIGEAYELCKPYNNIRVVPISVKPAETIREYMLSSFIFDVIKYVKTPYYAKVDGDCALVDGVEDITLSKEVFKATATMHKWRYTKCKSDPEYERTGEHWLHKLDRICDGIEDFKGTKPLFKNVKADGRRIGHLRGASFFAIYKTNWTKHLAKICKEYFDGEEKMLIPSEDTMQWYCITRMGGGRSVRLENQKRYFNP